MYVFSRVSHKLSLSFKACTLCLNTSVYCCNSDGVLIVWQEWAACVKLIGQGGYLKGNYINICISSGSSDSVAGVYFPYLKLWIRVDVSIYGGLSLKMVCRKQKKTRKRSTVNLLWAICLVFYRVVLDLNQLLLQTRKGLSHKQSTPNFLSLFWRVSLSILAHNTQWIAFFLLPYYNRKLQLALTAC